MKKSIIIVVMALSKILKLINQLEILICALSNKIWSVLWIYIILMSLIIWFFVLQKRKSGEKIEDPSHVEKTYSLKIFFASLSGSLGLGSIIFVSSALIAGGPSVIIWLWVGFLLGRLIKIAEIYFSLKNPYTLQENNTRFCGPMVYSRKAFPGILGIIMSIVLSMTFLIYSVEIYQFSSLVSFISILLKKIFYKLFSIVIINKHYFYVKFFVTAGLITLLFMQSRGRFLEIRARTTITFMSLYLIFFLFIFFKKYYLVPSIIKQIIISVKGSTQIPFYVPIAKGMATAIYSGDVGIGYEGMMQRYNKHSKEHLKTAFFMSRGVALDAIVCSMTIIILLLFYGTNITSYAKLGELGLITKIFSSFPMGQVFFTLLCFLSGFSTVCAYFHIGSVTFKYLYHQFVKKSFPICEKNFMFLYYGFAVLLFTLSPFYNTSTIRNLMSLASGILIFFNCIVLVKLFTMEKSNKNE